MYMLLFSCSVALPSSLEELCFYLWRCNDDKPWIDAPLFSSFPVDDLCSTFRVWVNLKWILHWLCSETLVSVGWGSGSLCPHWGQASLASSPSVLQLSTYWPGILPKQPLCFCLPLFLLFPSQRVKYISLSQAFQAHLFIQMLLSKWE